MSNPSAAILVIGDEILSGRTRDSNLHYLSCELTKIGIDLQEARLVQDEAAEIVDAVKWLSSKYDYLFTSGGIGPTHDDITADCIAEAFGAEINVEKTHQALQKYYLSQNIDFNNSRQRMARIPNDAKLIENPISVAPGFQLENVFVMAGVPNIFQSMVQSILPSLTSGKPLLSKSVKIARGEGEIAADLKEIASNHKNVSIGSYPYNSQGKFGTNIVVRGTNSDELDIVAKILMSTLV